MLTMSHYMYRQRLQWASSRYAGRCVFETEEPGTSKTCTSCGFWHANLQLNDKTFVVQNVNYLSIVILPVLGIISLQPTAMRSALDGMVLATEAIGSNRTVVPDHKGRNDGSKRLNGVHTTAECGGVSKSAIAASASARCTAHTASNKQVGHLV